MFDNIGRKIKNLAELVTWLGIIGSVLVGFVVCCIDEHMILPGLLIMVFGSIASWLSSFLLYAFGQQVESTENIEKMLKSRLSDLGIQDFSDETMETAPSEEKEREKIADAIVEKEETEEDKRAFIILIGVALLFLVIILICAAFMN